MLSKFLFEHSSDHHRVRTCFNLTGIRDCPYTAVEFHVRIDGRYNDVIIDSNNYTQCGATLDCAPQNYNYKTGHRKLIAGDYK